MNIAQTLMRMLARLRYPVSLPQEIAEDLGVDIPHAATFPQLLDLILARHCQPKRLQRFMPRERADLVFRHALRRERFLKETICSYYFRNGWLEFRLYFDECDRLRRLYIQHSDLPITASAQDTNDGIEIPLQEFETIVLA